MEVGEYVRYDGIITRVVNQDGLHSYELENGEIYTKRDIKFEGMKHSENLIDLVEERRYFKI